jgi:putative NADH-flavin reductase
MRKIKISFISSTYFSLISARNGQPPIILLNVPSCVTIGGSKMSILLLGASGRVGREFLDQAKGKGHTITALVRKPLDPKTWSDEVTFTEGNVLEQGVLFRIVSSGNFNAVVNVLGGGLKKSTVVTESTRLALEALSAFRDTRYVGISVLTLMPKNIFGTISASILSSTFLKNVDHDHGGALALLQASSLDWTLVACGQIVDGRGGSALKHSARFIGGYRMIEAGDVAREIWREVVSPEHHRTTFGVWA